MKGNSLIALVLLATTACGGALLGPGERRELEEAEQLWNDAALTSYAFDYFRSCFCPDGSRRVRVTVEDGAVTGVSPIDGKGPLHDPQPDIWPTVAELFDRLDGYAVDDGHDGWNLSVVYDGTLGYPTEIDLTAPENLLDGGSVERLSNLTAT